MRKWEDEREWRMLTAVTLSETLKFFVWWNYHYQISCNDSSLLRCVCDKCRDFPSNFNYHHGNVDIRGRAQNVRAGNNTFLLCGVFCIRVSVRHNRTFPLLFFIPLDEMQTFHYFNAQTLRNIFLSTRHEKSYLYKMQTRTKYFN